METTFEALWELGYKTRSSFMKAMQTGLITLGELRILMKTPHPKFPFSLFYIVKHPS